jgi:AhpD family alkylhydroperoxidase
MDLEQVNAEAKNFLGLDPYPAHSFAATPKVRELIGIALSALTSCPYCTFYHSSLARANGATDTEIEAVFRDPESFLKIKKLRSPAD